MAVLDMATPPNYIPARFFMHFGVRGDKAVRTHLDYFRTTGMDFVKSSSTVQLSSRPGFRSSRRQIGRKFRFFRRSGLNRRCIF